MEASPTPKNGQVYKYKGPFTIFQFDKLIDF